MGIGSITEKPGVVGKIVRDDRDGQPYKVKYEDGTMSQLLDERQVQEMPWRCQETAPTRLAASTLSCAFSIAVGEGIPVLSLDVECDLLVTACGVDRSARIWSISRLGAPVAVLRHDGYVLEVAISLRGGFVATIENPPGRAGTVKAAYTRRGGRGDRNDASFLRTWRALPQATPRADRPPTLTGDWST